MNATFAERMGRMKSGPKPVPAEVRFWSHVDKNGPIPAHRPDLGPCWVWTGRPNNDGYGRIATETSRAFRRACGSTRMVIASRFAFALAHGPIPEGMLVCHTCDNPACVRVEHLFLGTIADNNRDMDAKGRRRPKPRKSLCIRGHVRAGSNLYIHGGKRVCRQCANEHSREWKRQRRLARAGAQ